MANLSKEKVKEIIRNAPEGTSPAGIIAGLRQKGHTLEGYPTEAKQTPTTAAKAEKAPEVEEEKGFLESVGDVGVGAVKKFHGFGKGVADIGSKAVIGAAGALAPSFKEIGYDIAGIMTADDIEAQSETYTKLGNELMKRLQSDEITDERKRELFQLYTEANPDILKHVPEIARTGAQKFGSAAMTALLPASVATGGGSLWGKQIGTGLVATVGRRIGTSGATGALAGASKAVSDGKDWDNVIKDAGKGAALGVAVSGAMEGGMWLLRKIPKIMSFTSDVPEGVLNKHYKEGNKISRFHKTADTKKLQKDITRSVTDYKKSMVKEYGEGLDFIADSMKGKRVGLNTLERNRVDIIFDEFKRKGFENAPQNLNSFSAKEGLKWYNELNSLTADPTKGSGQALIQFRKALKTKLINMSGGQKGAVANLLNNYSAKKTIVESLDDIVRSDFVSRGQKTKAINTARNNLNNIFNDNKGAYIEALESFEELSGANFSDELASLYTKPFIPPKEGRLTPTDLFRLLASPLGTSPRLAGFYTRFAGGADDFFNWTKSNLASPDMVKLLIYNEFLGWGKGNKK